MANWQMKKLQIWQAKKNAMRPYSLHLDELIAYERLHVQNTGSTHTEHVRMSSAAAAPAAPRTAASLRKRNTRSSTPAAPLASAPQGSIPQGMFKIYTDDSPGIKVDPVIVLVGTLFFIASVFFLHIIAKWTRH